MEANVKDELRKYYGLPPYHGGSNFVVSDGIFYNSIKDRFGEEAVEKAKAELLVERRNFAHLSPAQLRGE